MLGRFVFSPHLLVRRGDIAKLRAIAKTNRLGWADAYAHALEGSVDQNKADGIFGVGEGEVAHNRTPIRVTDEDKRAFLAEFLQRIAQLEIDLVEGTWEWAGRAPCVAGAIVGADAGELLYPALNEHPIKRKVAQTIFDDHDWGAVAGTVDMQLVAAKID